MNPLHIHARNYRTFESLDIDLPAGCVAIVGANGAGKSSLLNAIDVALFAARGELADLLTVGEDELEIVLEFEHGGELYRVRRQYSARGRGKTVLDFERARVGTGRGAGFLPLDEVTDWEPLTRETAEQTQKLIEDTIGLSRTTFRASSFLRQGDGAAFTEASPRERKAILAEILGLDLWERLQTRARGDLRVCEDDLVRAAAAIAGCDELIARKPELVRLNVTASADALVAQAEHDTAVEDLERAQQRLAAAAVQAERIRGLEVERVTAFEAHARTVAAFAETQRATGQLADKQIELDELAADADRVPDLERQLAEARAQADTVAAATGERDRLRDTIEQRELARGRMVSQALQLHQDAQTARMKADRLDEHIDEASSCDRCGQTLGAEAAARAAASYRAEADDLDARGLTIDEASEEELAEISYLVEQANAIVVPELTADLAAIERDLRAARAAAEQRARVAEQLRQLTEISGRRALLEGELVAAATLRDETAAAVARERATAPDEDELAVAVADARSTVGIKAALLTELRATCARLDQQLASIAEAEQRVADHQEQILATQQRVDVLKLADRAYGRDGIPALIVENAAIPQLELEANRILGELGGKTADCRIELRTQKALKTSDALRDTLDIVIVTPAGERTYETFSTGEDTRLNLALRLALAKLLAHRRGAESRLLTIDEPDGLDADGMERLTNVLRGLGDFDRIYVISHNPVLATAFDTTVTLTDDGGRSRVGADVEAVAA